MAELLPKYEFIWGNAGRYKSVENGINISIKAIKAISPLFPR